MAINVNINKINQNSPSFTGGASKLITIKNDKVQNAFKWFGNLSTPANRLFLGATALSIQPMIDLHNKDVDEETRKMSFIRTIAKIVVGTFTGILVRVGCIKWMKRFTCTPEDIQELAKKGKKVTERNKALIPTIVSYEKFSEAKRWLGNHRKALGSFLAIAVMMITDPPLSKFLTNFLNNRRKKTEQQKADAKGGK